MTHFLSKSCVTACCLILFLSQSLFAQKLDSTLLAGMKPRQIGPAGMSGRVTCIDVVLSNPQVMYIGTASGGVWKSESGGIDWQPIFENESCASIGAITIDQQNPDIIWVGTGEGNPRNSQSSGYGLYRSLDGGKSWQSMGLEETRNIHRLIIHPEDPNTVYVGAIGYAWADSEERGVYKTTDGGESWEKILYINERTGVADMVLDSENPNKLLVAMWEYRRWPWFFKSGGEGSGLYITYDGGKNWKQKTSEDGLPKGELGRMGLAIAPSKPDRVYAFVESKKNALYMSEDGGSSWKKQSEDDNIGNRPFYYADIYVDPQNENRIYSIWSVVSKSEDAGKTFKVIMPYASKPQDIHPDHHAWWIHPENSDFMMNGNDGGLNITFDGGKTWRFASNLPVGQFYHVNIDDAFPYNVMGGMQDNGSWVGPAYNFKRGGLRNEYYQEIFFGDGFDVMPDKSDSRYIYAMYQRGNVGRIDLETGASILIQPVHPNGEKLRFNWNAGIAQDPFDAKTIYFGSQYLHKSTSRGDAWQIISPDLTTNDPEKHKQHESGGLTFDVTGAENYTSILCIAPSPLEQGFIWVGTDDGNLQITKDGGQNWENVVSKLKGAPEGAWIPQIHVSEHQAGEAFVVLNDYRRGDWTPYVYHTQDYGASWKRLAEDVWGYALAVVQDPVAPNLLFLGTEFGLYVSVDYGETWTKWNENFPTVSTMDMKIHPREHDLVIGTFGRAIFVLDDIRPLREIAQEGTAILSKTIHAFPTPDAILAKYQQAAGTRFAANATFIGENRPSGGMITYSVGSFHPDSSNKVRVEILDAAGNVTRTFSTKAKNKGINRVQWDLRAKGVRFPGSKKPKAGADEPSGLNVLPGTYTVRLTYQEQTAETTINVILDPRLNISMEALTAKRSVLEQNQQNIAKATEAVDRIDESKKSIKVLEDRFQDSEEEAVKALLEEAKKIKSDLDSLREMFVGPEDIQGIIRESEVVSGKLGYAAYVLGNDWEAPNDDQMLIYNAGEQKLHEALQAVNYFYQNNWVNFRQSVENVNFNLFEDYSDL